MLTVAATSNKTVVGEDNTALSKINKGLYDRYKSDITIDVKPTVAFTTSDVSVLPFRGSIPYEEQYVQWLISFGAGLNYLGQEESSANLVSLGAYGYLQLTRDMFDGTDKTYIIPYPPGLKNITAAVPLSGTSQIEQSYISAAYNLDSFNLTSKTSFWETIYDISIGDWNKENIDTFSNSFKDVNKKWNNLKGKGKNNPEFKSGFIPFNLSLTMDGLGGMKIYQKFNVDTDFMPSNYPANIEFLIKNIQHTVKDNKWITKLESFCVSKPGDDVKSASTPTVTSTGLGLTPKPTPPPASAPTACGISTVSSHPTGSTGGTPDYRAGITNWIRDTSLVSAANLVKSAKCNLNAVTYDIYNPPPPKNIVDSGNMGCAAAVSLIFYRATGYSITQKQSDTTPAWPIANFPGSVGTSGLYAFFTNNPSLWKKYELKDAKPGDIIITERFSATVSGHVGIVIDTINADGTYDVISNTSSGYNGSRKGTIQQNYTVKGWSKITKKNPTKTFCFRYSGGFRP
jgi:hypothetical protein